MDKLAHFEIMDPPTKYVIQRKRPKQDKDGNLITQNTYYLTNNLFYGGTVHWAIQRKCINYAKDYIIHFLKTIPKMQKCRLEVIYHHTKDGFDLDNKVGFWVKMILDIMKTPSSKEILKAQKYKNKIKTIEVIPDDDAKYVDEITMKYKRGQHRIEVIVYGILKEEQTSLF